MTVARAVTDPPAAAPTNDLWRQLWSEARRLAPNAEPDRCAAVARALGATPRLLTVADGASGRGLLIGRETKRRQRQRIGYAKLWSPMLRCLDVVYGGVLCERVSLATIASTIEALRGEYDLLTFNHVTADSDLHSELDRLGAVPARREPHWRLSLDDSFDQTMRRHSSKHRSNLRRLERRLTDSLDSMELRVYETIEDSMLFADLSEAIARRSYHAGIGAGPPPPNVWRALLRVEAASGRLRSYALFAGDRPIAYQAGALYGRTFHCEGTAFAPEYAQHRPGTVLFMQILQRLCGAADAIDFGFGDADYKRLYGTDFEEEVTLHLFGRSRAAQSSALLSRTGLGAERLLRNGAAAIRMTSMVKRSWRRRATRPTS